VPLPVVAEGEAARAHARIARVDGLRTVTVRGDVDRQFANVEELLGEVNKKYLPGFLRAYPGVELSLEGESAESHETNQSIARAFMLGLMGVFVLLSFQFRSWIESLVVMVTIPLALIGVIWGHLLLTSLTTIAGLTPLMLEKSLQAQFLVPLAASIVFGMLASTVLVLIIIPCMYAILGDFGLTRRRHEAICGEVSASRAVPAEPRSSCNAGPARSSS